MRGFNPFELPRMVINPFRNRVWFVIERLLLSGTISRLAVGAALIGLVAFVMGLIGYVVTVGTAQAFGNLGEAVWWAFLRLSDPGYLGDDQGTALRVVSTLVTVAGYVLFLGVLVAILTQGLNEAIRKLEMGLTPISARGHVLILGWSSRLPGLVRNMLESEQRLKRFLERVGVKRLKLVLLWEEVSPALTTDLLTQVGGSGKSNQIILRSGSPLRLDHLTRVDYLRASAIVLPTENRREEHATGVSDNAALKTIFSIARSLQLVAVGEEPPLLVVELFDARKIPVALNSYRGPIEVVAGDEVISRMLSQMVRHPQISQIYRELLTHGFGNEIYVRGIGPDQLGRPFWDLAATLPEALLIGVAQAGERGCRSLLNPPADYRLGAADKLIYIAREWEAGTPPQPAIKSQWSSPEIRLDVLTRDDVRILVVGWSHRIPAFLRELESYTNQRFEVTVASRCPLSDRERQLQAYGLRLERVVLTHVQTDCTVPEQLVGLAPGDFSVVMCLASDLPATDEESDARTLVEYEILQEFFGRQTAIEKRPRLLIELLDELNVGLIDQDRCEYLLSPQVLSHMLGQVALRRELNVVFEQLFNSGETEITFRNVLRYGLNPGDRLTFAELQSKSRRHHEVALGYLPADGGEAQSAGLLLNPSLASEWTVAEGDRVVVLRN